MLVVTRKSGQSVLIPSSGIEVCVVRVQRNGSVRLGLKATEGVGVYREELLDVRSRCGTCATPEVNTKPCDSVSRACSVGSSNNTGAK
jgi:carbon storage regulator CsrA